MHRIINALYVIRYRGEQAWHRTYDLQLMFNISSREVQIAIQQARLEGAPIISGDKGYKWGTDRAEVEACIKRLRSRAIRQMETARDMSKGLDTHFPLPPEEQRQMEIMECVDRR